VILTKNNEGIIIFQLYIVGAVRLDRWNSWSPKIDWYA